MVRSNFRFYAVFALALSICWISGLGLHRLVLNHNNALQLDELSQQVLRRAEKALDYVVIAQTELLIAGHTDCSAATVDALRQMVVDTGTISKIFIVTPTATCSSSDELSAAPPATADRLNWIEGRNPAYRIGRIEGATKTAIGVSWGLGTELEIVVAISADALLFDVLPEELREKGRVELSVDNRSLARFAGDNASDTGNGQWETFSAEGFQYPLTAEIRVDSDELSEWRMSVYAPVVFAWTIFGFIVSAICAWASVRGRNQGVDSVAKALRNKEIEPHFQPIVDLKTGAVVGCEVLARWNKPGGKQVSPAHFIPLVEQHGLDYQLLSRMVEGSARIFGADVDKPPAFFLSFNVTPDQLGKASFAEKLASLVERHSLQPKQVCIEITERQVIASPDQAAKTTAELCKAGFRVALDDAGTGHNGLAALQVLDVNTIKIDKFFIDQVHDDPRSRVMIDMFVSVARRYGMTTVAEGVETEDQVDALKLAGVDAVQGFYYAKPVSGPEFIAAFGKTWKCDGNHSHEQDPVPAAVAAGQDNGQVVQDANTQPVEPRLAAAGDVDEAGRLAALYRYQILDTAEEEAFERIPRIIRNALDAPMAAIGFIDSDRRWFKAVDGGKRGELARSDSFCNHTIQHREPLVVSDTLQDDRFQDNPLVVDAPNIRAYLGVPLETPDGYRIGSVCCVDKQPRSFTKDEIRLVKDLSSVVMEQLELRRSALFDQLTAVRSRHGFCSQADLLLDMTSRENRPFSLLLLDIDHFKLINDQYGHKVGDEVLSGVGQLISSAVGECGVIGRMGGEEFAVALPHVDADHAVRMAELVRSAIGSHPLQTSRGMISVRVSVGVAGSNTAVGNLDELLVRADKALYQAKIAGRNRVNVYERRVA